MKTASFESLEFLLSPERDKYYAISLKESPAEKLMHANYPSEKIITIEHLRKKTYAQRKHFGFWANEKKQILHTDLNLFLKKYKIKNIMPDTRTSPFLEKWANEKNIKLISTPYKFQKEFENKIFFDTFLHKHNLPAPKSWQLKSEKDLDLIDKFPVILQIPDSDGASGTFLKNNKTEITEFIKISKIKFPLLCREFIDKGIPLGISILISQKKMIFSAIRMQACTQIPNGKNVYYGIQWLKTSFFPAKMIEKINKILWKTGKEMQKIGFCGIAAFDFVMKNDEIYFIECNPRTGGSTPQLSFQNELLHGLSFTDEFIRSTTGKELTKNKPFIPESDYEGFCLDCGFMGFYYPKNTKINSLKSGIYKFKNGKLQYISCNVDKFIKNKKMILINYIRPDGIELGSTNFLGFLITHFPLLKINGMEYSFLEKTKPLLEHIENLIIKK